ncbi:MAG: diguanylate cyclase [Pseudohongiella sp.]|uniref:diguanylate cyclase n=1 Tax=Pseudohongiella sp. TaxID=1979412 RepID=UPI0034A07DC9
MHLWAIPSFLGACVTLYMSVYAFRRIQRPTGAYVAALGAAMAWWCAMQWGSLLWHNLDYRYLISQLQYVGIASVPVLWLSVALSYCGYHAFLSRWYPVLWIMPVLTVGMAISNEFHGLLWQHFALIPGEPGLSIDYGPWFRANVAFSYMSVLAGTVLICIHIGLSPLYRLQLLATMLAPVVVLGVNLPFVMGGRYLPIDPTPIGFVIAGVLMLLVTRRRFFSALPVARRLTMDNMSDGLLVVDNAGIIVDSNPVARKMLGAELTSVGSPLPDVVAEELNLHEDEQSDVTLADGRCLNIRISDVTTRRHVRTGQVILFRDVTQERDAQKKLMAAEEELRTLNEQLRAIANTDDLTQLANRRRLYEVLTNEWSRAERHRTPLSIIMFDFDHFKHVNDTYGHQIGDKVLQLASQKLTEVTRPEDLPARHGGEEFALLLPETSLEQAVNVAKKVHKTLAGVVYSDGKGTDFSVTVSLGVASKESGDTSHDSMVARADRAMYRSKNTGRNGVSVARGEALDRLEG